MKLIVFIVGFIVGVNSSNIKIINDLLNYTKENVAKYSEDTKKSLIKELAAELKK